MWHPIAIILAQVKSASTELYPLTKNYSMGLLPIGNKKLIMYHLQALAKVRLDRIVIVVSGERADLQNYIETSFVPKYPQYPHKIGFIATKHHTSTFQSLQDAIKTLQLPEQPLLLLHADTINAVPIQQILDSHREHRADLTLCTKDKKTLSEQDKKVPEGEAENEIDNCLIGTENQCLFMDLAEEVENSPVKIDPTLFRLTPRAQFHKVVDSKTYLFSPKAVRIIAALPSSEIYEIKPELLKLLVENQTNKQLLKLTGEASLAPLRVHVHCSGQEAYIRRINSKKAYESLNFESLIRGGKQKEVLMPTAYSDAVDDRKEFKGNAIVATNAQLGNDTKVRRSCIGEKCRIGKKVDLLNSVILGRVEIRDNVKICDSVIGEGTVIGEGAIIRNTYCEAECRVADGAKLESQNLIKAQ